MDVHNAYPVLWQKVSPQRGHCGPPIAAFLCEETSGSGAVQVVKMAVEQAGQSGRIMPFCRSGALQSPGAMTGLFWAGDQLVTWDSEDGMATVIKACGTLCPLACHLLPR